MACNKVRILFAAVAALGLWCAAPAHAGSLANRPAGIELACAADISTPALRSGIDFAADVAGLTLANTATAVADPAVLEQLASDPQEERATLAVPEPATIGMMGLAALFGGIAYSRYRLG